MDWRFILQLKLKINTDRFDVGMKNRIFCFFVLVLCLSNVYRRVPIK